MCNQHLCSDILKQVCSESLSDASFEIQSEGNKLCLKMIHDFLGVLEHPTQDLAEFETWFKIRLRKILDDSIHTAPVKVDRERMWSLFHQMRSDTPFQLKWNSFLEKHNMPKEPLFYQHVTTKVFAALLKQQCEVVVESPFEETQLTASLNYEEENAVRYIGGYILRSLNTKANKEKDTFLREAIDDLKGDSTELPTESEEWTGSVDRGGLIYISEATYQFLVAVEYSLRRYLKINTAHLMSHEFRKTLTEKVTADDDVQFNWTIASAAVEEDVMERLFDGIIKLYITIRGFSFASSILEMYKKDGKKGTQKKKTLRQSTQ